MHTATLIPAEIMQIIEIAVEQAVERAISAGKKQAKNDTKERYKETEQRLYNYPTLIERLEDNRERLKDMLENGKLSHGASLVRYTRTGTRLKPDEILEALIQNLEAEIAADESEVAAIKKGLKLIKKDQYSPVIYGRYIEVRTDEDIAEALYCDPSTVRRNRSRLMRKLVVWFYGAIA